MMSATAGQGSTMRFRELLRAYRLRTPFRAQGILGFAATYMRIYLTLSPLEQRHADTLATRFRVRLEAHAAGVTAGHDHDAR